MSRPSPLDLPRLSRSSSATSTSDGDPLDHDTRFAPLATTSHLHPHRRLSPGTSHSVAEDDDEEDGDDSQEEGASSALDDDSDFPARAAHFAPALATPKAMTSSMPWPYTSLDQASPTMPFHPSHSPTAGTSAGPFSPLLGLVGSLISSTASQTPSYTSPPTSPRNGVDDRRLSYQPVVIPASSLPHEIVLHILRLLPVASLSPALLVCKAWCQCGVELLWHKPTLHTPAALHRMLAVLADPDQTFPYPAFVKRINLSPLHAEVTNFTLERLTLCTRIERLTLAGCNQFKPSALCNFLQASERLVALDLTEVKETNDEVVSMVAKFCPRLQGLNLSGCKKVTDVGVEAIALACPSLRRMKLRNIENLTDVPIILLSLHCPLLLELDLIGCTTLTSLALQQLARTSLQLRELSLHSCHRLTDTAFPPRALTPNPATPESALTTSSGESIPRPTLLKYPPSLRTFEHLRYLDLTALVLLTDDAIAGVVKWMPRIRNLIIAKCTALTNESVFSICGLGKHLHYLHMGHCSVITDAAVVKLARSCTRLRYIDLAYCNLLTDLSVFEFAQHVPRLKRIGLVRVVNLTDHAIHSLLDRPTLERIHLSYCENVSVQAIHKLLDRLQRLTHLSLTGVPAFRHPDLQKFCRPAPKEFNTHQQESFCVYSGKGVAELRRYLRSIAGEDGIIPALPTQPAQQPRIRHRQFLGVIPPRHPNAPGAGARGGNLALPPGPPGPPNGTGGPAQPAHGGGAAPLVQPRQFNPIGAVPAWRWNTATNTGQHVPAPAHLHPQNPTNNATVDTGNAGGANAGPSTRGRSATVTAGNYMEVDGDSEDEESGVDDDDERMGGI